MVIKVTKKGARAVAKVASKRGKEVWRVTGTNGQVKNLVTRSASTHAMDKAMVVYARALKSLANR
jgi:hypothetical protein